MGFNMVYRSLVELFPQVDIRILKAVAIEHAKDVEGAVEAVLTEVVPYVKQNEAPRVSVDATKLVAEWASETAAEPEESSVENTVAMAAQDCGDSDKFAEGASETAAELEESSNKNTVATSAQVCAMDLLEERIEGAKNNKISLSSEVESVIGLIREVGLQDKALVQVKEMADNGGSEILAEVEELRKMLVHAKEANDMHVGEVYGEKAILTTEMRELQARLVSMSGERDESLSILNEMRCTLEERLSELQEGIRAAEQQKAEKEDSARVLLAKEKEIMEKVLEESAHLQKEAEENAKLREFLMDRGRIVDTLQGELAVICQDVKLLKERFDNGILLSDSLTLNQIGSFFASSSSSSSSTTLVPDQVPDPTEQPMISEHDHTTLLVQKDAETEPMIDGVVVVNNVEDPAVTATTEHLDDDWEFFEVAA